MNLRKLFRPASPPAASEPPGGIFHDRLFRLFQPASDLEGLSRQVQDLRATLLSAIQDIAVLKAMLRERQIWEDAAYKRLRVKRMISDHSSAGASPWRNYSSYPYTLEEPEFLREVLSATPAEIEEFKARVAAVEQQT